MNDFVILMCTGISTRSREVMYQLNELERTIDPYLPYLKDFLPRTAAYLGNRDNKGRLLAGTESCTQVISNFRTLLAVDLQDSAK